MRRVVQVSRRGLAGSAGPVTPMSPLEPHTRLSFDAVRARLDIVRKRLARPLTLGEKILYGRLEDPKNQDLKRGESYLR